MPETRIEKDTMGEMPVPADVLYGASTQRAVLNFPVSGRPVPFEIVAAYAAIKSAAAAVNASLHSLDRPRAEAIIAACRIIAAGLPDHGGWPRHFPVDVFQTGSGTSTNMNINEVIANLVCLARGKPIGSSKDPAYLAAGGVHPNDHVNMGQSSNDTFPTAMHLAAAVKIHRELLPAVRTLGEALEQKATAWDRIVKIGRTHLQDATPIRLGQEFSGYASQMRHAEARLTRALDALADLSIGGTAVGTGINTHEDFGRLVAKHLTQHIDSLIPPHSAPSTQPGAMATALSGHAEHTSASGLPHSHPERWPCHPPLVFREATNHFESQHAKDAIVEASGHLKTIAVSLTKIANDIRLMGSGPRCGIGELVLPAVQPGSSIMPGKVNPVICEAVVMACCQVIGNDTAIGLGGLGGVGSLLDLNVAMPMMADNLIESIHLLARACAILDGQCLRGPVPANQTYEPTTHGLQPDTARCASLIEGSLAMCTSLVPIIGYDTSAALAKQAYKEGKTVRQLAHELVAKGQTKDTNGRIITKEDIDRYLDPWSMTLPGGEGSAGG